MKEDFLFDLLEMGTSPAKTVKFCAEKLKKAGFEELYYDKKWTLKGNKSYFIRHHGTSFFAFRIPKDVKTVRIAAAHTDYPCLKIKADPDLKKTYVRLNTEVYGGAILNTWLDRPLGISGVVALKGKDAFHPKALSYDSGRPILTIPNLAIHMNREINKGVELNRQLDMLPLFSVDLGEEEDFLSFLAEELHIEKEDILDFDLSVYCYEKPVLLGRDQEFLSSPRLDNLTGVAAVLEGIFEKESDSCLQMAIGFDHEEIGSKTKQGAGSFFLHELLNRIFRELKINNEERDRILYQSMLLSVDVAHGLHPNHEEKADLTNRPVLTHGFCIKKANNQSYITDVQTQAILLGLCIEKEIPYQIYMNRSDIPGGSTLGAIAGSFLPIQVIDVGVPILAMHSAREVMGYGDYVALERCVKEFFAYV